LPPPPPPTPPSPPQTGTGNAVITLPFIFDLSSQSVVVFGEDMTLSDASFNLSIDMSASIFTNSLLYTDADTCGNMDISFIPIAGNMEYEINRLNSTAADAYKLVLSQVTGSNLVNYTQYSKLKTNIAPREGPLNQHFIQYISSLMFGHPQAQAPIKNDDNIIQDFSNCNLGNQFVSSMYDLSYVRQTILEQLVAADISGTRFDISDNDGYYSYPFRVGDKITFGVAMQGKMFVDSATQFQNISASNTDILNRLFANSPGITLVPEPQFDRRVWKITITLV
jgi:hypothetical protein